MHMCFQYCINRRFETSASTQSTLFSTSLIKLHFPIREFEFVGKLLRDQDKNNDADALIVVRYMYIAQVSSQSVCGATDA